jgi:CheY-like chemotaxis protein
MTCNGGYVLVVDDDATIRDSIASVVEDEAHGVKTAANGRAALDIVRAGPRPSVILLDIMMPVMDGNAMLAELRCRPAWAEIPVYLMTASGPGRHARPGVVSVLRKPFDFEVLTGIIGKHC